jgi:hypothetical protein
VRIGESNSFTGAAIPGWCRNLVGRGEAVHIPESQIVAKYQNDVRWLGEQLADAKTCQDRYKPQHCDFQATSNPRGAGHGANLLMQQE